MIFLILFFLQNQNVLISEIEFFRLNRANLKVDLLSNYKNTSNYDDWEKVYFRKNESSYENKFFIKWRALRTAAISKKENIEFTLDSVLNTYDLPDKDIVRNYFYVFNKVWNDTLNFQLIHNYIAQTNLKSKPLLVRYIYYLYLHKSKRLGIYDDDYFNALIECYRYDKKSNNIYNLIGNHTALYFGFRVTYFFDYLVPFVKEVLKIDLKAHHSNYKQLNMFFTLVLLESYKAIDQLGSKKELYLDQIKTFSPYYKIRARLMFKKDSIHTSEFEKIKNSGFKKNALYKNEVIKYQIGLTENDTSLVRKSLANLKNKYKDKYFPFYNLAGMSFLGNSEVVDALEECKKSFSDDIKNLLSSNMINSSVTMDQYIEFYLYNEFLHRPKFALNTYLFFVGYKSFFRDIKEKLLLSDEYRRLLKSKHELLETMDRSNNIEIYVKLIKIHLKERELIDLILKSKPYVPPTYEYLQNKLHKDQILTFYMGNFKSKLNIQISKDSIRVEKVDNNQQYLANLESKEIVLVSNSHIPTKGFDQIFVEKFKTIPNVSYLLDIMSFTKTKPIRLESISFWGTGKPFEVKNIKYPKLNFVNDEAKILKKFSNYFTYNRFEADVIHFSSHYVNSNNHSMFNKIAYEENSDVKFFSGYDLVNKTLTNQLTVLNTCTSNKFNSYDNFSGEKSFVSSFLNAGSRSVLATSSEIDDYTSAILIEKFYHHLFSGIDAIKSLQLARKYIYDNISKSPKYWSMIHFYGENFKIETRSNMINVFLVFLILGMIFIYIKKK